MQKKRYEHVSYAKEKIKASHTKENIITVFYAKKKKKLRMLLAKPKFYEYKPSCALHNLRRKDTSIPSSKVKQKYAKLLVSLSVPSFSLKSSIKGYKKHRIPNLET